MFGRERSLVQRYGGKSFVLLGVNAEESRAALALVQRKEALPFRSWWDGPSGPIGREWNVDRYPTFVLIDRTGKVRWRQPGIPPEGLLEEKIDALLAEAK
jgi:hypothetical protein